MMWRSSCSEFFFIPGGIIGFFFSLTNGKSFMSPQKGFFFHFSLLYIIFIEKEKTKEKLYTIKKAVNPPDLREKKTFDLTTQKSFLLNRTVLTN